MRPRFPFPLILTTLLGACEKDDDGKGGGDCNTLTFEILGTKADGDAVPAFLEQMDLSLFKDKKSSETKDGAGKLTESTVYEYDENHNETKSTTTRADGSLKNVTTATYTSRFHTIQSVDQTYSDDGKSVKSTETTAYEYVDDSNDLAKYTSTVTGGDRDGEVTTSTMTYDASGRVSQSVDESPDSTYTMTYDYGTNTTKETRLDKMTQKTRETIATYRSLDRGEVVKLSEKRTNEDGTVTTFTNACTDVGRRIDCQGTTIDASGKVTGTEESSVVLVRTTFCGKPYVSEHELKHVEVRETGSFKDRSEHTDGLNAAGGRERVRISTFDVDSTKSLVSKHVTTFDESNQNEVKTEDYEGDVLKEVTTYVY